MSVFFSCLPGVYDGPLSLCRPSLRLLVCNEVFVRPAIPFRPGRSRCNFAGGATIRFKNTRFTVGRSSERFLCLRTAFMNNRFRFCLRNMSFRTSAIRVSNLRCPTTMACGSNYDIISKRPNSRTRVLKNGVERRCASRKPIRCIRAARVA